MIATECPLYLGLELIARAEHEISAALLVAVAATACATNPVTGKRELSFMSEAQEISVGRELDAQVRQEMGLYENDELQRYVQELGMRLARSSQRPNLPWSFAVLDSPAVNAFALPGGFIYITRGILPYLDNEAQLVGVLGHEIGHVTARHSAQQYTRGMGASLGVLVGSIFVPAGSSVRRSRRRAGIGVLFLKFGRDDELQADALGAEYAAGGGWDPDEVPAFLTTLARIAETTDRNGVPNWLSTHPQPENRAARVGETVKKVRTASAGRRHLDGRSRRLPRAHRRHRLWRQPGRRHRPRQPVPASAAALRDRVSGGMGDHQQRRAGRRAGAGEQGVHGAAHDRAAAGTLARSGRRSSTCASPGYKATDLTPATIGGMQAVVGTYEGNASGIGKVMARGAHVVLGRKHVLHRRHRAARYVSARVAGDFDRAIQSFRQMSQDEADAVEPNLIDLYTAREGDTWQSIAQRAGKGLVSASTLAIMNDHAIDEQPKPGTRLKIVVAGS